MPTRRIADDERGRMRWVREPYAAAAYTAPAAYLERLRANRDREGTREMLEEYGGHFHAFHKHRRFEREGKSWIVLVAPDEWAIELELTDAGMGEVRAVPPEEAWKIARERDAQHDPPVEIAAGG